MESGSTGPVSLAGERTPFAFVDVHCRRCAGSMQGAAIAAIVDGPGVRYLVATEPEPGDAKITCSCGEVHYLRILSRAA